MEWVNNLEGQRIGLDTAPLLYFIERHERYFPIIRPFFAAVDRGDIRIVASTLTLTEVLVHPYRRDNHVLVNEYLRILEKARHVTVVPVSLEISKRAARFRAQYNLRTPDAIQLATAVVHQANAFLTNDAALEVSPCIPVIVLSKQTR